MKNMLFLANIRFYIFDIIFSMCAIEFAEKLALIYFALSLHDLKMTDDTLKILTVVAMETYSMMTKKYYIRNNCQFYFSFHLNGF